MAPVAVGRWGGGGVWFTGQRLYRGASVHYRDETEIYGFVAPGGLMTVSLTALGSASRVAGVSRARAGDPLHGVRTPFTGARSQRRAVKQKPNKSRRTTVVCG